jgi:hypothetical protein
MLIKVTQEDIDIGRRNSCIFCPVARAINRALRSTALKGAIVFTSRITPKIYHKEQPVSCRVKRFIVRFDHGLPVEPFNFRVRVESRFENSKEEKENAI